MAEELTTFVMPAKAGIQIGIGDMRVEADGLRLSPE